MHTELSLPLLNMSWRKNGRFSTHFLSCATKWLTLSNFECIVWNICLLLPLPPTSSRKKGAWHKTSLILLKGFVVALLKIKFPGRDFNRHNSNSFWRKKTVGAKWRVSCSMSWRVPKTSWKRQTQNLSRLLLRISHVGLKLLFSGRLLLLFGKC